MKDIIDKYLEEKEKLTKLLKNFVKNKNISLEERWNCFIKVNLGNESWRTSFGLDRDDTFLYEGPSYMEKCEVRSVEDILNSLKEDDEFELSEEEEITFKEYCLDNFYSSMKFDW